MLISGVIGFILGALCGIMLMCILQINRQKEDYNENM